MVKHITVRRVVCLVLALTSIAVLDRVGRMCFPKEKVFAVDESWTELMKAARAGRGDEVRRLAEKGPDLNARGGRMGLTPLIVAAANGHVDVVTILLDRGARPDEPDSSDMTALMNAVMFDQPAVVQVLLERGADVNARTGHGGMTPLMFVNNSEIASMLLLKGAEAQAKTTDGQTALDRAEARGQTDLAEVLRIAARQPAGPPVAGHTTTADAGARQPRAPVANAAPRTLSPEPPVDRLESGNELSENMSENMPENRQPARLTGGAVPRIVLQNPVAGFSLAVPEDWDMATGNAGNTEIAIDAIDRRVVAGTAGDVVLLRASSAATTGRTARARPANTRRRRAASGPHGTGRRVGDPGRFSDHAGRHGDDSLVMPAGTGHELRDRGCRAVGTGPAIPRGHRRRFSKLPIDRAPDPASFPRTT